MKPLPRPNMNAKPKAKNSRPHRQVSTMHSIKTLTVSRERQKPASSIVKPTCMPKTRKAATSVQTVLIGLTMSVAATSPVSAAAACDPIRLEAATTSPTTRLMPTNLASISV